MVSLPDADRERCYFHLGYGASRAGIDAGDIAQVEESFVTIKSEYALLRIQEQLDICDEAWEATKLTRTGSGRYTTKEIYLGDINRSITRESAKDSRRVWWENYLQECDELAHLLWCPNYRDENILRHRYERSAQAFIRALPGVADTAISSRKLEFQQLAGSFGTL